ncbi:hypothetical protein O5D80_002809 [Batrachochytrium dendrobatidis]|nr:hypothetical protein O5D80_002809 [Batrachochytrium dendrobatidis]
MDAVKKGDLAAIKKLALEKSSEYVRTLRDLNANTILHISCHKALNPLFEYAMQLEVDVNAVNCAGDTALILSTKRGDLHQMEKLIAANAEVGRANDHGNTPLHYAAFWRHTEAATLLVKTANAYVNTQNIHGKTPIQKTSGALQKTLQDFAKEQGDTIIKAETRTKLQISKAISNAFKTPVYYDWAIQSSAIQILAPISQTRTAIVYQGVWKTKPVAVKLPAVSSDLSEDAIGAIANEISAIRNASHGSLLPILAACITPPDMCYLTEYIENGNLSTLLHNPAIEMSPGYAMRIATDIIQALGYLHEQKPPIIHGNLKSANVMLMANGSIKLTDYGFTTSLFNSRNMFPNFLNDVEWLAPEILAGEIITDLKGIDIYAFGMLLHEIVTRMHPYQIMNAMAIGIRVVVEGQRPEIPVYVPKALVSVIIFEFERIQVGPDLETQCSLVLHQPHNFILFSIF